MNGEISKREILLIFIVASVCIFICALLEPVFKRPLVDKQNTYSEALRISDSESFRYAYRTRAGYVLAEGMMSATVPVSRPELVNQFARIEKVREEYTMHLRTYTTCSGSGSSKVCTTHVEPYWTWDYDGSEVLTSPAYTFLGVNFTTNSINKVPEQCLELDGQIVSPAENSVDGSYLYEVSATGWRGHVRWYYLVTPVEFHTTMFTGFFSGKEVSAELFNLTPDEVITGLQKEVESFTIWYFIIATVVVLGITVAVAIQVDL